MFKLRHYRFLEQTAFLEQSPVEGVVGSARGGAYRGGVHATWTKSRHSVSPVGRHRSDRRFNEVSGSIRGAMRRGM